MAIGRTKLHAVLFSESVDHASYDNITAVADQTVDRSSAGDDAVLPEDLPFLAAAYVGGSNMARGRAHTNYLANGGFVRPYFLPVDTAANPGDLPPVHNWMERPIRLTDPKVDDQRKLNFQVMNDSASASQARALVLISDGPVKAADMKGAIPVRFTGSVTPSAAESWAAFTPTPDEDLADGVWEMVHARVQLANPIAWRIVPKTGLNPDPSYKPGWVAQSSDAQKDNLPLGALGPLCRFRGNAWPQFEIAASAASAQSPEGIAWVRKVA